MAKQIIAERFTPFYNNSEEYWDCIVLFDSTKHLWKQMIGWNRGMDILLFFSIVLPTNINADICMYNCCIRNRVDYEQLC